MSNSSPNFSKQSSVARPSGSRATRRSSDPISSMRTSIYKAGKILGHVSAIQKGTIGQRILRSQTGKISSRGLSGISRLF